MPGITAASAGIDGGVTAVIATSIGTVMGDSTYSLFNKLLRSAPTVQPLTIDLAVRKMREDFAHSIIHDRSRVDGAAEEALRRYQAIDEAQPTRLIAQAPPRIIQMPTPVMHGRLHPKKQRGRQAETVVEAAKRLRKWIKSELKEPLCIVSASINVGMNLTIASAAQNYDLDMEAFTHSRMGVEQVQQLVSPSKVEFQFGVLPEGPLFYSNHSSVNDFTCLAPVFFELQRTLTRTAAHNRNRRRRVYYFANSSSEEQFRYIFEAQKRLEGAPLEYLEDVIAMAHSGLDDHDWLIVWEPLASSLMATESLRFRRLHEATTSPFQIIFWLVGSRKLQAQYPDIVRDFVYVLSAEWNYLKGNEAAAINELARSREMLESFALATAAPPPSAASD